MLRISESRMKLALILPSSSSIDEVNLLPRDLHFRTLTELFSDNAKVRHSGGVFSAISPFLPILVDSCRFWLIPAGFRAGIYAVVLCNPPYDVRRQCSLSLGHSHLPEEFLMGS